MLKYLAAEGTSDPYYDDPANEAGRLARIHAILQRQPDAKQIAFFIAKTNNDNFVTYKWDGKEITSFWISTQNVPAERRDTLNLAEEMMYGVDTKITSNGEWLVNLRAEAVRHRTMNLTLDDDDRPSLVGTINGKQCVLESAYVQMRRGLIPDVEYVKLFGKSTETGEMEVEIVKHES
jgi:hypothetical protein